MSIPIFNRKINIDFHFRFSIGFIWLIILLSMPYLVWELYWAIKVGYPIIKWHTHLAVYYYLCLLLFVLLQGLDRIFHFRFYLQYHIICASVCFALMLTEAVLMRLGIGDTYSEKIKHGYFSMHSGQFESYYRTYPPDTDLVMDRIDFKHTGRINSLGYSDREWSIGKRENEKRILCLGDSWTEGIGAGHDSTYVSILGSLLRHRDTSYTIMNAGTAGDDPGVNFINYRDRLRKFRPDIIIQTLSSNDMNTDIATKGGLERFQKNGTVKLPDAPWWEPIYALSYISRAAFHAMGYSELLIREPFSEQFKTELNNKAKGIFEQYSKLADKDTCLLIVVLQPYSGEIQKKAYSYDLSSIVDYLHTRSNVRVYDLMPYYVDEAAKSKNGIRDNYWSHDGHHNPKGYAIMAGGMLKAIDSFSIGMRYDTLRLNTGSAR